MNIYEIASKHKVSIVKLEKYIKETNFPCKESIFGIDIDENLFLSNLEDFNDFSLYQSFLSGSSPERSDLLLRMTENGKKKYLKDEELAVLNAEVQLAKEAKENELQKRKDLANMLISSGFSFDGYRIVKYSGYISGDDCITIPRDSFFSSNKVEDNLCEALVKIRRQALKELKEAAYDLGCNAVIGVDFDYITMDPQHTSALRGDITVYEPYVICVTANGNAVVIEKDDTR